jgi:hypothetical protein
VSASGRLFSALHAALHKYPVRHSPADGDTAVFHVDDKVSARFGYNRYFTPYGKTERLKMLPEVFRTFNAFTRQDCPFLVSDNGIFRLLPRYLYT